MGDHGLLNGVEFLPLGQILDGLGLKVLLSRVPNDRLARVPMPAVIALSRMVLDCHHDFEFVGTATPPPQSGSQYRGSYFLRCSGSTAG
jgi:hypothetical protein